MRIMAGLVLGLSLVTSSYPQQSERWSDKPQNEWPQITMVSRIEYVDKSFPVAPCGFLLDTGKEILAVTAKHVLTYFKSEAMKTASFGGRLKSWVMFPKNNPVDTVVVDALINEDPSEPIDRLIPSDVDWLLFSIKSKSDHIRPLKFRPGPLRPGEKVYIIGWRYSDKDRPQVVYEGNYVESIDGSVIISTKLLADNRTPGLSGAPVVDSDGFLVGVMSQKYGKLERLGSIEYPQRIIKSKGL